MPKITPLPQGKEAKELCLQHTSILFQDYEWMEAGVIYYIVFNTVLESRQAVIPLKDRNSFTINKPDESQRKSLTVDI